MMKHYSFLFGLIMILSFGGCERKIELGAHEIHWDRDMCVRCKMVVSDRHYAAQTTDPTTGKQYCFDDIGCLILWFKEENITWAQEAVIWVTDVHSGAWINAKEALWSTIAITPMAFGYAAYLAGSEPKNSEVIGYDEMVKRVIFLEEKKKSRGTR